MPRSSPEAGRVPRVAAALTLILLAAAAIPATAPAATANGVYELVPDARYLLDADGTLTADAVHKLPDTAFGSHHGRDLNLGISTAVLWLRVTLPPVAATIRDCLVVVPSPIIDRITLFYRGGSARHVLHGGDRTPYADRAFNHRHIVLPFPDCAPGTGLLIRVSSDSAVRFRAQLMDRATLARIDAAAGFWLGLFYGLMLALFIYNLLLVFADYDRSRLWYLGYLLAATAVAALLDGLPGQYPPFTAWPQVANAGALLIAHLLLLCGLNFVRTYIHTARVAPMLDRLMRVGAWGVAACALAAMTIGGPGAQRLLQFAVLATVIVITLTIVRLAAGGSRQARVMLIVFSGLALTTVLWSLQTQGIVDLGALGDALLPFGFALEALLLSFALADRIRYLNAQQILAEQRLARDRQTWFRRLLDAREQQQRAFAQELHDAIGQNVLALKTRLDRWAREAPEEGAARYREAGAVAAEIINTARELAHELHPSVLDRLGLVDALAGLAQPLLDHDIAVDCELDPALNALSPDTAVHVYRIFQEAISNILRHAGAARVTFTATAEDGLLCVRLQDDGAASARLADVGSVTDGRVTDGLGLNSMRERARMIGARFELVGAIGSGTTLELWIDPAATARDP